MAIAVVVLLVVCGWGRVGRGAVCKRGVVGGIGVGRRRPFRWSSGEGVLCSAVRLEAGFVFCEEGVEVPVFEVVGVRGGEGKGGFGRDG